ncbi:MAG: cyclic pyranopterin monophosphate synthase MoaC [Candidatus Bathyarchaeota archaeon]|nr:cyclic pyranopterin monophosphate synthase MoaC [Candidatus Bathyarchaeota archaeon]
MVDVSDKPEVVREAQAVGTIRLKDETVKLIKAGKIQKGDPLRLAEVAGILAAKQTSTLIPLCHPLPLTKVKVQAEIKDPHTVQVLSTVKTKARTGVEMEALVAVAASLLAIWDMVKQYEKDEKGQYPATVIQEICVLKKIKEGAGSERKYKKT